VIRVVAFDPGLSGAMVAVDATDAGQIQKVHADEMPLLEVPGKRLVNGRGINSWLRTYEPHAAVVEQVGARPGQGVTSMFTFGRALGTVEGVIQAAGVPLFRVTPQVWQRAAGALGVKDPRGRCVELIPQAESVLRLKKHVGRADALLMAFWWLERKAGREPLGAPTRATAAVQW
jgi:crossover junction endodeoxyribonuclease RuvC